MQFSPPCNKSFLYNVLNDVGLVCRTVGRGLASQAGSLGSGPRPADMGLVASRKQRGGSEGQGYPPLNGEFEASLDT